MARRLNTIEANRAQVIWQIIVAMLKEQCQMLYTPDLIRELTEDGTMTKDEVVQAIRDLLSHEFVEMHFAQDLKPVPKKDEPFVFPAPATTSKKNFSPYPLPYLRRVQKEGDELCGADHCGANAPDFEQAELFLGGSFVFEGERQRFQVNLEDYDIIAVNSSGGKDSQAMLDAVFRECRRLGIEDRIHVYFADLERAEWEGTPALARRQTEYYGVPFDAVKRPQGDLVDRILQKGEWPGAQFRYCTSDLKRGQIARLFTRDTKAVKASLKERGEKVRPVRILNCLGIRAQEGSARAKKRPFRKHHPDYSSGKERHVDVWFPIFKWTNVDVWTTIAQSGVPHHWAYDTSMSRLSCALCIMGDRNSLLLGGTYNPELLDTYVEMEQKFMEMPQKVERKGGKEGVRASQFTADNSIAEIKEAILAGEKPSGEMDVNS